MCLVNQHPRDLLIHGSQKLVKAKLVRKKKKFHIKTKRTNLTSDWNNFQEAAAAARKTCKEAYNLVSKAF